MARRKCKICKEWFEPTYSNEYWCSPDHGYKYSLELKKRQNLKAKKEFNLQDSKWLKTNINKKVQELARLIDSDLPCLARGNYPKQMHGGHILSKGGNSQCKWNLHNIHRQSAQSNTFYSDDALIREKLSLEYGKEYLYFIHSFKQDQIVKFTNEELKEKYDLCLQAIKYVKDFISYQNTPLSKNFRISLRNEINLFLGFYPIEKCVFKID